MPIIHIKENIDFSVKNEKERDFRGSVVSKCVI